MDDVIIIFGSSRSDGNTRKYANYIQEKLDCDLVDLVEKKIDYYDYEHTNLNDDFFSIIEYIVKKNQIIFITPVYWYSMSSRMKTFFDRLTDLTTIRKELGKSLEEKKVHLLSCSWNIKKVENFEMPFEATAKYFKMNFIQYLNVYSKGEGIPSDQFSPTDKFIQNIIV